MREDQTNLTIALFAASWVWHFLTLILLTLLLRTPPRVGGAAGAPRGKLWTRTHPHPAANCMWCNEPIPLHQPVWEAHTAKGNRIVTICDRCHTTAITLPPPPEAPGTKGSAQ